MPVRSPWITRGRLCDEPVPDAEDARLGVTGREEYGEISTLKALAL
jgi:hypothetical protein